MVLSEVVNGETYHLLGLGHDMGVDVVLEPNCKDRLSPEEDLQGVELLIVKHLHMGTSQYRSEVVYSCTFNPVNVTVGSCRWTRPCWEALRNSTLTGRPLSL